MTLAALDLLAPVVALLSPPLGGLDALRIDAGGAGGRFASLLLPHLGAQGIDDLLPSAVRVPGSEVIPDRALGQQVMRQVAPLHARPRLVQTRVDHLP